VQEFDKDKNKWEIPKDDPIYGESLTLTWKELNRHANTSKKRRSSKHGTNDQPSVPVIDFGVNNFSAKLAETDIGPLLAPKTRAPVMFPVYLDLWAQTSPQPLVTPHLPLFLHGPQAGPADLQIVWRTDLDDEECWESEEGEISSAIDRVAALPPSSLEAVAVPFAVGKRWLLGQRPATEKVADIDRPLPLDDDEAEEGPSGTLRAIIWRGNKSIVLNADSAKDLRPGDTVVVPSFRGGLFMGSFDPFATDPVPDLAERASFVARAKAFLRLHPRVLAGLGLAQSTDGEKFSGDPQTPWLVQLVTALKDATTIKVDDSLELLKGRRLVSRTDIKPDSSESSDEDTTDPEISSFKGHAIKLSRHSHDVERWARNFCERLGLLHSESSKLVAEAIIFAAWLHDVGKADPRFQCLLRDGSEIAVLKDKRREPSDWLLAKSGMDEHDARRRRASADRSGYPPGTRHEILSLAMIQDNAEVRAEAKRRGIEGIYFELVLHLVASHHGWCRPYPPAVIETDGALQVSCEHGGLQLSAKADHRLYRLDGEVPGRFARLNEHFGPLQLAWFEAILRLADHRASEEEASNGSV
jgi:CRISPR-associated endonuclease/helicase Cas3